MKQQKRIYGLLPVIGSNHHYQVGKVRFQVSSYFTGKVPIEEQLADLMLEDLGESRDKKVADSDKNSVAI
nr:hypothetical protein [Oscillospiraceae bacterium]